MIRRKCRLFCFVNLIIANISEIVNQITRILGLYLCEIIRNSSNSICYIDNGFVVCSDLFVIHYSRRMIWKKAHIIASNKRIVRNDQKNEDDCLFYPNLHDSNAITACQNSWLYMHKLLLLCQNLLPMWIDQWTYNTFSDRVKKLKIRKTVWENQWTASKYERSPCITLITIHCCVVAIHCYHAMVDFFWELLSSRRFVNLPYVFLLC